MDRIKDLFRKVWDYLRKLNNKQLLHQLDLAFQIVRRVVLHFFAFAILAIGLLLGVGMGYMASILKSESIPTVSEMDKLIHEVDQTSTLYFADNSTLGEIQSDIVSYKTQSDEISPWIKKAIVSSEDEDFYLHQGIMPRAVVRAAISDLSGIGMQSGGSTLTQQLVKMQILSSEATFKRKATEIFLAMRVSKFFSKDDVLTSYLNAAPFGRNNRGENIAGVGAAAAGIFGKKPRDLSIAQSAFIAGLVQSPYAYTPFDTKGEVYNNTAQYGLKRAQIVLFRMYRSGVLTKKEYEEAKKEDLRQQFLKPEHSARRNSEYGYTYSAVKAEAQEVLTDVLMKEDNLNPSNFKNSVYNRYYSKATSKLSQNGYKVYSTINRNVNDNLQKTLQRSRNLFSETHKGSVFDPKTNDFVEVSEPVQNGTVVLDNKSGAVIGFVGGVDFKLNEFNHAFDNRRSPGSSIKPLLVFAPAIDAGIIGSRSVLSDFPVKFADYAPTDYGQTFQNRFVPATEALAQSYNVATVHLYQALLQKDTKLPKSYMDKMNFEISDKEYNELGISLGGTVHGCSPLQEAGAYATFANDGNYQKPYLVSKILDPTGKVVYEHKAHPVKVYSEATAYIMRKMMAEVVQNGTADSLGSNVEFDSDKLYGKTGTSNDNRDYWFTGSTPGITISSWIGYDNLGGRAYNLDEDESKSNLRLVARYLNNIYQNEPNLLKLNEQKSKPNSVKEYSVLANTGTMPGVLKTNITSFSVKGRTVTSLFAQGGPKELVDNFGIGGYASDYRLFWSNYLGQYNGYGVISRATKDMKYDTSQPKVFFSYYETPRINYRPKKNIWSSSIYSYDNNYYNQSRNFSGNNNDDFQFSNPRGTTTENDNKGIDRENSD